MGKKSKSQTTGAAKDEVDQDGTKGNRVVSVFPKSADFIKVMTCVKKGNRYKTNKFLLRGCESGCTYSLSTYAKVLCYSVDILIAHGGFPDVLTPTGQFPCVPGDDVIHHENFPIAMPICLEGLIRGSSNSFYVMIRILYEFKIIDMARSDYLYSNNRHLSAIINYWSKYYDKQNWLHESEKDRVSGRVRKENLTRVENFCHGCYKQESETVTLEKCGRCNYYYYCSTECQKKKWQNGHAGECNHVAILNKYHRPHGKHIRDSLINGIDPKNIPELQELRHRLGLDKPKAEYEVLLDQANRSDHIKPIELVPPNKDGTVQIGSYPYSM